MLFPLTLALAALPDDLRSTDLLPEAPGADALCFWSEHNPKGRRSVEIPVSGTGELVTRWVMIDGEEPVGAPVVVLTLRYADGHTTTERADGGKQISARPMTATDSTPVMVGTDGQGQPRLGAEWRVPVEAGLASITLNSRLKHPTLCLLDVRVEAGMPLQYTDTAGWYSFPIAAPFAGLPGLPPIEAPAGARGGVTVGADGHFYYPDGSRARFWGINLVGPAAFPPKEEADAYAATLAALGFNMVRLHHLHQGPPRGVIREGRTGMDDSLDPEQLDRFDYFVSRLKAHGLYLWLEVTTDRTFKEIDGVAIPDGPGEPTKGAMFWEADRADAYVRWFRTFWGRTNPYTKTAYADDPMVAVVELSNENSIAAAWGFTLEGLPPAHRAALDRAWNDWLKARYADASAITAAWTGSERPGLQPGEALGTIRREPALPQLADGWPTQRRVDLLAFYADLEAKLYQRLDAEARAMGFDAPIVPSIAFNRPRAQVVHAPWPVTDIHIAYDKLGDDTISARSALENPAAVLPFLSVAVEGKAMCASELNHPFPNPYRAEGAWLWAALAGAQDWDALLWFSYADGAWTRDIAGLRGSFDLRTNTVMLAHLPAASAAFRAGAIPPADGFFPIHLDPAVVARLSDVNGVPSRPWELLDVPFVLRNRVRTVIGATPRAAVSGTAAPFGWWPGLLVVDQPTLQVRVGPPGAPPSGGAGPQAPSALTVELDRWAAVSMASLDGAPLGQAQRALLTVSARQENTGQAWLQAGRGLRIWGNAPVLIEPVQGTIVFPWPSTPTVTALGPDGQPVGAVAVEAAADDLWRIHMEGVQSPWLLVGT